MATSRPDLPSEMREALVKVVEEWRGTPWGLMDKMWDLFIGHHQAHKAAASITYYLDTIDEEVRSEYLDRAHGR